MAGASLLRVDGLTMQYAEGGGVTEISFEVCDGEIVGLLGPNGSGKSTTLHCIIGINEVPAGSVTLLDLPHHLPAAKNVFGFLPDDLPLPESLRMREIFALNRRLRPGFDEGMATELVTLLGLAGHTEKYIGQYSHGMKRKLQLVTALAHRPRLLILDEPLRGLDPEAALLLRAILEFFSENGGGVLVATRSARSGTVLPAHRRPTRGQLCRGWAPDRTASGIRCTKSRRVLCARDRNCRAGQHLASGRTPYHYESCIRGLDGQVRG